ncbi:hypothetical protein DIPPA_35874 [Diplonema papillatum]|nr:hypothetical protein DIPPA_35874 [Diplonema papillatum]
MILHILADYILPKDNFVISVDEKRPFSTLMGLIITRLEMPSMAGHALYICKGKPPRPTIPLLPADLKKSPKKLGMKQGDFLMIKKEAGGIKERKEAIKKHQKDVQLQEEDPETFKRLERERSRIQRRENFFAEKIRDADSDDELPKEVILGIMGPVFAAAAIAVIAVEIGSWLEPRQLSKLLVTLAAAVASAVPTYFGDREYTRRAALLKAPPAQQARRASPRAALLADPGIVFTTAAAAKAAEGHFDAFFARLAGLYRAKPGDVVDEILASFAVAADLTDPLFAVASAAFALRERFFPKDQPPWFKANTGDGGGEEAGPPPAPRSRTEVDALVLSTLGVDAAEVDRALLCGMPADNTRRVLQAPRVSSYVPAPKTPTAIGLYRAKPGDVVDEILASFAVAADLTDPLFAVASAAFALRERFFPKDQPPWFKTDTGDGGGEEAGPPPAPRSRTEVDALVLSTLGVDAAEVDRALLCGMPADNTRRVLQAPRVSSYVPAPKTPTAIGLYRAKPGDVVDEILASFAVAADLTDPLFAVASAAFALRERFFPKDQPPWFKTDTGDGGGEEAGPPPAPRSRTEVDALVLSTLGVDAAEVDRALLCGMPADNTRRVLQAPRVSSYVPAPKTPTAIGLYRAKPGDVVDEILASFAVAADLTDPLFAVASAAFALRERFFPKDQPPWFKTDTGDGGGEEAGPPPAPRSRTEVDALVLSTLGVCAPPSFRGFAFYEGSPSPPEH